jgi:pyruvate,water dikinase
MKEVQKRKMGCFLLNSVVYSDLKKLNYVLQKNNLRLEKVKLEDISEIHGITAMRGYARGIVKNIRTKNEISKVKPGDILVTQMTSPDYIPAIKVSSAIITDEGGSLCHAAIVSRELGIPCVIGSKIATKVLKDGDLVGVDANKGVVKILKRVK